MSVFHQHEEGHCHAPTEFNRSFMVAIISNGLFVIFQIIFAYLANSTSLLADGIHNLGDVLSLILAWVANHLLATAPTEKATYGLKKTSILAAFANVILLVFTCGIIATEAIYKFITPAPIEAGWVMLVAGVGIVVNAATAFLFAKGQNDLNIRAAFLHLVYDAIVSVGVVLTAVLIYWTHWNWLDPLVGLAIAGIILKGIWGLLTDTFRLIIDGVPREIILSEVQGLLAAQPGVKGVHDLHVWALSTKENALSVHLWMPEEPLTDAARYALHGRLRKEYRINHVTIQVERDNSYCPDTCTRYL